MADEGRPLDSQGGEKVARILGELAEGELVGLRLRRFAEPDLVRRDDAIARVRERVDGGLPGRGAKILAVEQHGDVPVRRRGLDVHIGHVQRLTLRVERVILHGIGIVEALEFGPVGGHFVSRQGRRGREGDADQRNHE